MTTSSRRCPLCDGQPTGETFPYRSRWEDREYTYLRCGGCGTAYLDPLPSEAVLSALYAPESYFASDDPTALDPAGHRPSIDLLTRLPGSRSKLLDFGCGNGAFMVAAHAAGFDVSGIEYTADGIASVRRATGLPVDDLHSAISKGTRFDVVHLGDVLEHVPQPFDLMRTLERLLAPDGLFFIEGPLQNNASIVQIATVVAKGIRRRLGRDRIPTYPPYHLLLTHASAQKAFFTDRLGYRALLFDVLENGWPYRGQARTGGIGGITKEGIALAAVLGARVQLPRWPVLGNRFQGLFEVRRSRI